MEGNRFRDRTKAKFPSAERWRALRDGVVIVSQGWGLICGGDDCTATGQNWCDFAAGTGFNGYNYGFWNIHTFIRCDIINSCGIAQNGLLARARALTPFGATTANTAFQKHTRQIHHRRQYVYNGLLYARRHFKPRQHGLFQL